MTLKIVIMGLSITSSWGNGHATTYRALTKALSDLGHSLTFLERDVPWYREHRDLENPEYCRVGLYRSLIELAQRYSDSVRATPPPWPPIVKPGRMIAGRPTCASARSPSTIEVTIDERGEGEQASISLKKTVGGRHGKARS